MAWSGRGSSRTWRPTSSARPHLKFSRATLLISVTQPLASMATTDSSTLSRTVRSRLACFSWGMASMQLMRSSPGQAASMDSKSLRGQSPRSWSISRKTWAQPCSWATSMDRMLWPRLASRAEMSATMPTRSVNFRCSLLMSDLPGRRPRRLGGGPRRAFPGMRRNGEDDQAQSRPRPGPAGVRRHLGDVFGAALPFAEPCG